MKAEINTPGVIESYLHVSHLKRTRYSHEVTAVVLFGLLMDAFELDENYTELADYLEDMKTKNPQFCFWYNTLQLEIAVLALVRSQRTGDLELSISSLKNINP